MITETTTDVRRHDHEVSNTLSRYYTEVLGWPTVIDPATGVVHLRLGQILDALVMRAGFGSEVNHELVRAMIGVPIIAVTSTNVTDWIFLTQPRTPMRQSTLDHLITAQVGWHNAGDTIPLPASDTTDHGPRWVQQPEPSEDLPHWGAVVGAIRRTVTRTW